MYTSWVALQKQMILCSITLLRILSTLGSLSVTAKYILYTTVSCVSDTKDHAFQKDNGTHFIIILFVLINQTSFFAKTIEHGAVISNQILGRVKLSSSAFIQYKNSETVVIHFAFIVHKACLPVGIHDSVDSMSNSENGAIDKLSSNGLLDNGIRLYINLYINRPKE